MQDRYECMIKQQIIDIVETMQTEYSIQADNLFRKLGRDVATGKIETATNDVLMVNRHEAKADVLEELLNKLKELQ